MSEATRPIPLVSPAQETPRPLGFRERQGFGQRLASSLDDVRLALQALLGHKLRAALTLLGIVIGVFTVVSMMALMTGLQSSMEAGLGGLGANVFQIQKWPALHMGPASPEIQRRKNLTVTQALALREALPQAKQVGAEVWDFGKEVSTPANSVQGTQIAGGTAEFFTNNSLPIGRGRGFSEQEAMSDARIVVLGSQVVDTLFPNEEPLGKKIRLGRLELEVVGIIERQGGSPMGGNPDNIAAVPIRLFLELYGTGRSVNITVMAHDTAGMKRLQDQAVGAFRVIRGLPADKDDDFDIFSNESMKATFDSLAQTISLVMLCICAISLVVGGIGVMNIMLVAVAERTREIGLRKALGARQARVLAQFVIEAVLLAFFGGVLGVVFGYGASGVARYGFSIPTAVPLWAVGLALGVSSAIGLVFGIYPAYRASKLDPAVALRNE